MTYWMCDPNHCPEAKITTILNILFVYSQSLSCILSNDLLDILSKSLLGIQDEIFFKHFICCGQSLLGILSNDLVDILSKFLLGIRDENFIQTFYLLWSILVGYIVQWLTGYMIQIFAGCLRWKLVQTYYLSIVNPSWGYCSMTYWIYGPTRFWKWIENLFKYFFQG